MPLVVETARFLAGLEALQASIVGAAAQAMQDAIRATEASGKQTTKFRDQSGATRASIKGVAESPTRGFVRFGGASRLLEGGTRPHAIHGRPLLRFMVNGTAVYARMVKHPGTKATHFVSEARDRGAETLYMSAELHVGEAIRRVH